MTKTITELLNNNADWANKIRQENPEFFRESATQQSPKYLWIGCADSRVPASLVTGLEPGELFVHRNVSNRVDESDLNIAAVLQFSILALKIEHIIVCGHTHCGGVKAALTKSVDGQLAEWVSPIGDLAAESNIQEQQFDSQADWVNSVCELNVASQIKTLRDNQYLKEAAKIGHKVMLHGWIYNLETGLVKDLEISTSNLD